MDLKKNGSGLTKKVQQFLKETETEAKKVTWPDKKYVLAATIIVMLIVTIIAVYVMILDFGFLKLFEFLTKIFKPGI